MRLEILDTKSRITVGHIELDERVGVCTFIGGPPGLESLVDSRFSKGVFGLVSEREGDIYSSFTKRVEPDDDRFHSELFSQLAGSGFYAPELEAIIKQQMQLRRESTQNAAKA